MISVLQNGNEEIAITQGNQKAEAFKKLAFELVQVINLCCDIEKCENYIYKNI